MFEDIFNKLDGIRKKIDLIDKFFVSVENLSITLKNFFTKYKLLLIVLTIILICLIRFKASRTWIVSHINSTQLNMIFNFVNKYSNTLIFIIFVILCLILLIAIKRIGHSKNIYIKEQYKTFFDFHTKIIHKVRNDMRELYTYDKKVKNFRINQNIDAIKECRLYAFEKLFTTLQMFVNDISEYLSKRDNDTISVCIKIINSGQNNTDIYEKTAKTLVRSSNTSNNRTRNNETVIVGENSDFKHLCEGTNIWYHGVDLKTKYDNNEYFNQAEPNDWQKKYNSTFVVPIRYFKTYNGERNLDILGFLCIDSCKIVTHWDDPEPFELQYLAIYADTIYNYIKLFRHIFEEE